MISNKHIGRLVAALMTILVIFTIVYTYFPSSLPVSTSVDAVSMEYASTLFDADSILRVNIEMEESQWEDMLKNAISEAWYACDITVNGTTYKNVGIRPKGNTSLTQVASDDTTDRFSFKIKFDYYIDGQTCDGLDCLILNNLMSDASYMKEYLSYDMFQFMGVVSSLYSFADISLNGDTWGLYLALEAPDASFLQRNYGISYGQLYKPETTEIGGGMAADDNMRDKVPDKETTDNHMGKGGFGFGSTNGNLSYLGDDSSDYAYIFDNAITDSSSTDESRVIQALKNISEGTELEASLDIDQMLRYMAVNVFLVNLDSYFGNMLHNYLLYEEAGQLTMLPWDYNLAFAGFQSNSAKDAVNLAINSVVSGASLEDRPLLFQLMQVPEYQEKYHEYLDQLVSRYFESGYFEAQLAKIDALITSYAANDPTAFYTHDEYQMAVNALKTFCELRVESVRGQLNGEIPSTEEAQAETPDSLINTDSLNISDMGTQGGGRGGMKDNSEERPDFRDKPDTNMEAASENIPALQPAAEAGNFSHDRPQAMGQNMPEASGTQNIQTWLLYGGCFIATVLGLLFAKFYRRRLTPNNK